MQNSTNLKLTPERLRIPNTTSAVRVFRTMLNAPNGLDKISWAVVHYRTTVWFLMRSTLTLIERKILLVTGKTWASKFVTCFSKCMVAEVWFFKLNYLKTERRSWFYQEKYERCQIHGKFAGFNEAFLWSILS